MNENRTLSSEAIKTTEGRLYHIDLAPGDLAEYILLCVDPERTRRVAAAFDEVTFERANREFLAFTGLYHGVPLSVISTGIGSDNIEILFIEVLQLFEDRRPTIIRIGSCGGLQEEIAAGDLVINTGSVRRESTSTYFVDAGYPAVADYEVMLALIAAAEEVGTAYHVGLAAANAGFFGAQGRSAAGLRSKDPGVIERLSSWNVISIEMETSTLFTLGSLAKVRTGNVGVIYMNRLSGERIGDDQRAAGDAAAERVGLEAVRQLAAMDAWKKANQKKYYFAPLHSGL